MQSYLEQAFGKGDVTSARMRAALREWLDLYYGTPPPRRGPRPPAGGPHCGQALPYRLCRV